MLARTIVKPGQYAVAHCNNVAIFVWRTRADAENVPATTGFANQLLQMHAKFSVLHVIEDNAGLPTTEGRDEFLTNARQYKGRVACIGMLLPDSPVLATMMRAFVRGMRTLLRGDLHTLIDHNVTALVRSFVAAHEKETGVSMAANDLATAIEETRALLTG